MNANASGILEGHVYRTRPNGTTEVLAVYCNPVPGRRPAWKAVLIGEERPGRARGYIVDES
jgi:hypothetical protein